MKAAAAAAGAGAAARGLLMVMLPPLPGEAISSAPQPASTATEAARKNRLREVDEPFMGYSVGTSRCRAG